MLIGVENGKRIKNTSGVYYNDEYVRRGNAMSKRFACEFRSDTATGVSFLCRAYRGREWQENTEHSGLSENDEYVRRGNARSKRFA